MSLGFKVIPERASKIVQHIILVLSARAHVRVRSPSLRNCQVQKFDVSGKYRFVCCEFESKYVPCQRI
jgi:hypothetical protein